MSAEGRYYGLVPGVDVVRLEDGNVLLESGAVRLRLEGESASLLIDEVFPLLDGRRPLREVVASLEGIAEDDLRTHLDGLVERGMVRRSPVPQDDPSPFAAMLDDLGLPQAEVAEGLRRLSVGIVGLEAHGAHLARYLARLGVGRLVAADPYPCEPGDLPLMGVDEGVGVPRQELVAGLVAEGTETSVGATEAGLTRADVVALAAEVDLVVGCFDRGFAAANVWVNEAVLERGIPALFGQLRAHVAVLGPLVLPGRTGCYMCWRMRSIACADNFAEAMAYEEFLDRRRRPSLHERSVLPFLPELAASVLATQVLVVLLGISTPALAGNVVELNGLTLASEKHPVLQKPDCPACKKKETRPQPTLEELESADDEEGDLDEARARLVSPRCGVVKDLREVPRDASEPAAPYVFRAELANHRFVEEPGDELVASGKGMTRVAAMRSALGEAVERYSSGCWEEVEAVRGRRPEIGDEALDPRRLVLYRPEQYEHVPYAPYSDDTEIAWVPARSLVTSREVLVPALAASLVHQVAVNQEYLFGPSSNGLAAGSTLAGALLAATQEVLERDAFVIAWFNQLACAEVNPEEHPDGQIRRLSRSYARRGVALHLYKLPTDHPVHVFMGLALDATAADGPAAVAGLGADLHPARAAAKAVLEVGQVRPALRMRLRDPQTRQRMEELVADPHLVGDLHDHDLLYASPAMVAAFSFLAGGPAEEFDWRTDSLGEPVPDLAGDQLVRVVRYLGDLGYDVLYVNLTSPDMRQLRLHTVRVVIPEFQPIDFGWGQTRLGGKRMFELPHRLGLSARPTTVASVNDLPHPLA